MKYLKFIVLFFLIINKTFAFNEDPIEIPSDTIELEAIEITANRLINFTAGAKVQYIPTDIIEEYNSSNLSELLSQITPISIKSYGLAGQSSVALRGMHSKHTAILWNGINLQNTMNGGFDMNSIPSFFIDNISIQHGGAGALFGSGAVGGVIHLNNQLKFEDKIELEYQQGIASFHNSFEGFKLNYSNHRFANSTKVFYKYGKNDFEYKNDQQFGHPIINQENAVSEQYGILQSNLFKINQKQKISTSIWAQKNYLEIPPRTTSASSQQKQESETLRIATIWNRNGEISSWFSRFYYDYESFVYSDPDINLVSEMDHYSIIGEIENKVSIKENFLLNIGLNYTFEKVMTDNYGIDRIRNRTAIYSSLKYFSSNEKFVSTISIREELIDKTFAPFTYSLSNKFLVFTFLELYGNLSKTYNIPTFNDLYWIPGGDKTLIPEEGWSWDLGTKFNYDIKNNHITAEFTYFDVRLNDHIIWLPDENSDWSATNIEKLWSRGLESSLQYKLKFHDFSTGIDLNYTYTKSTYESNNDESSTNDGNQLIYIPKHKAFVGFSGSYKKFFLKFYNNYVGRRYIKKDNSNSIDPYYIADLSLGALINIRSIKFLMNFKIHNIWDTYYEVMSQYPMPQQYYSLSLTFNFNKSNN